MAKIQKKQKSKIKVNTVNGNKGNTPISMIINRKKKVSVKQIP